MEGYRSYPDDRGYPEPRTPEPGYSDGPGWYGGQPGDLPSPEPRGYEEFSHDHLGRPEPPQPEPVRPDPGRAPVGPRPGPSGPMPGAAGPLPGAAGPLPGEEPSVSRRAPVTGGPSGASGVPGPVSDGVYRSRRPAVAALVGVPAVILEIPALLLLADAAFGDSVSASGVISASCLVLALPLLAMGLYAVATGAVRAAGPNSAQAWLRPPVAYLTVALVLFVAAGLAA